MYCDSPCGRTLETNAFTQRRVMPLGYTDSINTLGGHDFRSGTQGNGRASQMGYVQLAEVTIPVHILQRVL
jgi:hypothetical protein